MAKPKKPVPHSKEFEALLADMRTKKSVAGALSLFTATPEELGKTASEAARREKHKR